MLNAAQQRYDIAMFFRSIDHRDGLTVREQHVSPPNPNPEPPVSREPVEARTNAERVSKSWESAAVKEARNTKSGVRVTYDGGNNITEHRSTKAAFIALDLPIPQHQKFRAELKACKSKHFAHEGVHYLFEIIDGE